MITKIKFTISESDKSISQLKMINNIFNKLLDCKLTKTEYIEKAHTFRINSIEEIHNLKRIINLGILEVVNILIHPDIYEYGVNYLTKTIPFTDEFKNQIIELASKRIEANELKDDSKLSIIVQREFILGAIATFDLINGNIYTSLPPDIYENIIKGKLIKNNI